MKIPFLTPVISQWEEGMNRNRHEKLTETVLGEAVVRLLSKSSLFSGAMLLRCLQEMAVNETDPERLQALSALMIEVQTEFVSATDAPTLPVSVDSHHSGKH